MKEIIVDGSEHMSGSQGKKRILNVILKVFYTSLAVFVVGVLIYIAPKMSGVSVQDIIDYTPASPLRAFAAIMLVYAIKSVTVVFPLVVIYVAVGTLFSGFTAVAINLLGLCVCSLIPYLLGRWLGSGALERMAEKHVQVDKIVGVANGNSLLVSFILRAINILPGDAVSFLLGANSIPVKEYIYGSLLGLIPVMIPATLLGTSLQSATDNRFVLMGASALILLAVVLCMYLYGRYKRRKFLEN